MSQLVDRPDNVLNVSSSFLGRQWRRLASDGDISATISKSSHLPGVLGDVLAARGLRPEAVHEFLNPTLRKSMPDPSILADMDFAVARIVKAVINGEGIGVFGDYDVDGATSTSLLQLYFQTIGVKIRTYIPDRILEGYGPTAAALSKLSSYGVKVVVTVDCGIAAFEALRSAKEEGLDVIVIDHHKAESQLPLATAVVNPNRLDDKSGQGHLAAVGVTFLLIVALNRSLRDMGWYGMDGHPSEPDLMQWLDLVALGTVCDVVPITGLNRAFVVQGLNILGRFSNPGIAALARVAGLTTTPTAHHLGFLLGPRINAGGRVGQAGIGARLLACNDPDEAGALALRLDEFNSGRKDVEVATLAAAIALVEADGEATDPIIFVAGKDWHPGVIGIVAARLKDRYGKPSFVIALDGGMAKGSARSVKGVDVGRVILSARDKGLLKNGGGHSMAAGFTITAQELDILKDYVVAAVQQQTAGRGTIPILELDAVIPPAAVNQNLMDGLARLSPFGPGNAQPRFALPAVEIAKSDIVGSSHVRCFLVGEDGKRIKGIAFRSTDSELGKALLSHIGKKIHVVGTLETDTWQGRNDVQLFIEDAAPI